MFYSPEYNFEGEAKPARCTRGERAGLAELLFDDCEQVFFAHHQQFNAIDLDRLAGVFAEQNAVADFDSQRADFAVFQDFAIADSQHFTLIRLFSGGFRQHDTRCGFGFLIETFNDNAVV
jgi:hypothetical protein